jgi:hypothetical protein
MPDVDERKVFDALLKYRLEGCIASDHTPIQIRLYPVDNHVGDSPDFLL